MDDRVFRAMSDPSRRLLLDRLFERDGRTLTELESELQMTRFGVMKHLRVLEEAGLVTTRRLGRTKLHYLNPVPIQLIYDRWIGKYAAARTTALADLKSALEGGGGMATQARPQLVYEIFIKAPPERVWEALTKPEFTRRYFHGSVYETDWKSGSPFRAVVAGTDVVLVDGQVLEADPPRRLVHTWRAAWDDKVAPDAPSRVTWELQAVSGMTRLTVIHDQFEGETETYRQVSGGWMWILSNLKTLLETGDTLPEVEM